MRERAGVWIAHGAGPADRRVVDASDKVAVPPDHPSYQLRRLWLEEPTFSAYYNGFANEGLWPLCHLVDVRPQFRATDWQAYKEVNERFARAVDQEIAEPDTPVFIQDYHLALVAPGSAQAAARRRERRCSGTFRGRTPTASASARGGVRSWQGCSRTISSPSSSSAIAGISCWPSKRSSTRRWNRSRRGCCSPADRPRSWRYRSAWTTTASRRMAADAALADEQARLRQLFGLRADVIGIGVDRLDYTKGIPERLAALDELLVRRPELRGRLTFVQIGVPSRSEVGSYAAIEAEIGRRIADINARHTLPGRPSPIVYHQAPLTIASLVALYRLAHFCIVSSLHDGMNLVAKEFVAARDDEDGVLVLSALAGAAQELQEALIINPYDVAGFADALEAAIDMPARGAARTHARHAPRRRRSERLRVGLRHPGRVGEPVDRAVALFSAPMGGNVRVSATQPIRAENQRRFCPKGRFRGANPVSAVTFLRSRPDCPCAYHDRQLRFIRV